MWGKAHTSPVYLEDAKRISVAPTSSSATLVGELLSFVHNVAYAPWLRSILHRVEILFWVK